ncbi:hypothetical protein DVH24_039497 [Malus domestica]|uniref:CAF1B/HIR1 beta-propeller domain-containing protein n=1 Tax=Malus domestica TaxID=3750 RepID=A0A498HW18_MALDO|nr:hypothetical protein DVH24_039497 [Malus domestica]
MKGGNVQINWHDNKPVLTLDCHPIPGTLATGGADLDIKLWSISWSETEKKLPVASYQNSLSYHSSAVNVVHLSRILAIRFHHKDVLDILWSIDGAYLISGSVDNSCIIWDVIKGSVHQILDSHCHYVQAMAWDPLVNYVASLSSDRTCHIYVKKPQSKGTGAEKANYVSEHVILKAEHPLSDDSKFVKNHLFLDETLPSFFRRLAWSPHGSFLLVPAEAKASRTRNFDTLKSRIGYDWVDLECLSKSYNLPGACKPVIAVRFHPLLFSLRGSNQRTHTGYIGVPPIAIFAGFHYVAITDIAWSPDAHCLALSSQDGYCTLVEFENDELGSPIYLIEEKKVAGDKKRSPVHKPEDMVNEATKNDSPVEKAENVPTEAMAANNLITTDSGKSKAEWNQLTEAEMKGKEVGGEENQSPVEKAR